MHRSDAMYCMSASCSPALLRMTHTALMEEFTVLDTGAPL